MDVEARGGPVVPNGVSGSEANPLRNRAVLLLRLSELLLRPERLVALWLGTSSSAPVSPSPSRRNQSHHERPNSHRGDRKHADQRDHSLVT